MEACHTTPPLYSDTLLLLPGPREHDECIGANSLSEYVRHVSVYVSDVVFGWKELVEIGNGGLQFHREGRLFRVFL